MCQTKVVTVVSKQTRRIYEILSSFFGLSHPVSRRLYLSTGLVLLPLKYCVEAALISGLTNKTYSPIDYLNPLLSSRAYFTADAPEWLGMAWILWSLPFLWLAVTFSVRRAFDAQMSPWIGLLMFVPLANLLLMLFLASIPKDFFSQDEDDQSGTRTVFAPPSLASMEQQRPIESDGSGLAAAVLGLTAGAIYMVIFVVASIYLLGSYGTALFFGTPVITGAVAAYFLNRTRIRSLRATIVHATVTMCVACLAFLSLGLEGIICIVMAMPIMVPLGLFGAFVGRSITVSFQRPGRSERHGLLGCVLLLPVVAGLEVNLVQDPTYEVVTTIEVNAPIETVWENVVQFSEIESEPAWYFRLGIAYPTHAHIKGTGIGAERFCEFTTGTFVEPVTAWEQPTRLAFDVTEQPEPMFELTPYGHIHPPHLDGSFRGVRGEFRLVAIDDQHTRLEGSTWYQLSVRPLSYWTIWTDWILHRIHHRVLDHIRMEAERASVPVR